MLDLKPSRALSTIEIFTKYIFRPFIPGGYMCPITDPFWYNSSGGHGTLLIPSCYWISFDLFKDPLNCDAHYWIWSNVQGLLETCMYNGNKQASNPCLVETKTSADDTKNNKLTEQHCYNFKYVCYTRFFYLSSTCDHYTWYQTGLSLSCMCLQKVLFPLKMALSTVSWSCKVEQLDAWSDPAKSFTPRLRGTF